MKIVTQDDIRYTEQTEALNEIAAKLGVVAYRPDYHGSRGDKNTVMFYTPEDEEHNRVVDRQPTHYSRGEAADLRKRGSSEIPELREQRCERFFQHELCEPWKDKSLVRGLEGTGGRPHQTGPCQEAPVSAHP